MSSFRIYYSDGSVYDEGDSRTMPLDDYQIVCEKRDDGRLFMHMGGNYCGREGGEWTARGYERGDTVLVGRLMDEDEFEALKFKAVAWLKAA